jgi:hypothetical protein
MLEMLSSLFVGFLASRCDCALRGRREERERHVQGRHKTTNGTLLLLEGKGWNRGCRMAEKNVQVGRRPRYLSETEGSGENAAAVVAMPRTSTERLIAALVRLFCKKSLLVFANRY